MEERFARLRQDLRDDTLGSTKDAETGGWYIKECKARPLGREDVQDEEVQKKLWQFSERMVEEAEKRGATLRAKQKKADEEMKEEKVAEKEMREYKQKIGKKEGQKQEGSRRSKKAG